MSNEPIRVLYVDDNPLDRELVRDSLEQEHGGFVLSEAESMEDFTARLAEGGFDLVLSDFKLLGFKGFDVLHQVQAAAPLVPVVIVTGTGSEEIAVQAMKLGAADYVVKSPSHIRRLPATIQSALERARLREAIRLADEQLRQSEAKFRSVVQVADIAIICAHDDGTMFLWNQKAGEIFGYSEEEILGRSLTDLMPARYRKRYEEAMNSRSSNEMCNPDHQVHGLRGLRADGGEFPMELSFGCWKSGEETRYVWLISNVTERRQAEDDRERMLHDSRERVKELRCLSGVAEAIRARDTIDDLLDDVVFLIPSGWQFSELSRARIRFDDQVFVSEDFDETKWRQSADIVIDDTRRGTIEVFLTEERPDLDEGPFLNEERFLLDSIANALGEAIEHLLSEEALRVNEGKLAEINRIVSQSPIVLFSWRNTEGWPVELVSRNVENIFGYSAREFTSGEVKYMKLIHPDDRERVKAEFSRGSNDALATELALEPYRIVTRDGRFRWIENRTSIQRDESGAIARYQAVVLDITRRVELADERRQLEAQLIRAQKMEAIGTLAGGIAHDFNNILLPIIGYTELVLDRIGNQDRSRGHLLQVMKAAQRAEDLVEQILTFSRQGEEKRRPVLLHLVLKEVLGLLRATLPSTIEVRQQIDTGCRPVAANPTQMHQVIMNLCTNAYQAIEEGGGVIEVTLQTVDLDAEFVRLQPDLSEGAHARISVRDTGHGMDQATIENIFEPFFTTKEHGKGTGLGLAVVHGIVVNHGGGISVYSEPGEGTTFHIHLPAMDSGVEVEVPESEVEAGGTEKILFVDDEPQIAALGTEMLELLGYTVTARTSALEALEAFRANPDRFDLVITDQTMPRMTGARLASELIAIRPQIPVILTSGFSDFNTAGQRRTSGVRERIAKPFLARDLAAAVRRVLDRGD